MTKHLPLSLVDPDPRFRALLVHALARRGWHLEPYEDAMELNGVAHFEGVFLTRDRGNLIAQVVAAIAPKENPVAVIAYSDQPTARNMFKAIRTGAIDYLGQIETELDQVIEAIQMAEMAIMRDMAERNRKASSIDHVRKLTAREQQILQFLAVGSTSREIGDKLGISPRTVEIHRANMQVKLGALNAPDAVRIGMVAGLVS